MRIVDGKEHLAPHGGRRQGQGHPTEEKGKQKAQAQSGKLTALLEGVPEDQWKGLIDALIEKGLKGDTWAIRLLMEHTKGKAATTAPAVEDTQIHLHVEGIPRPSTMHRGSPEWREFYDSLCSKCKAKLIGMGR